MTDLKRLDVFHMTHAVKRDFGLPHNYLLELDSPKPHSNPHFTPIDASLGAGMVGGVKAVILSLAVVLVGFEKRQTEISAVRPRSEDAPPTVSKVAPYNPKAEAKIRKLAEKLAQEIAAATLKGDWAAVIDHTYAPVVEFMGGRKKAIKATEDAMKAIKGQGIVFRAFEIGEPGEFHVEDGYTYVVIPTDIEMVFPGGKIIGKGYLLGISPDGGKTWMFADGAGIKDKIMRAKVLPKLPKNLKLPKPAMPKIIKDN